ncbi:MAG: hypothetical protein PQ975_11365 [Methanobacterium sp.]|jgi:hypothetical protein
MNIEEENQTMITMHCSLKKYAQSAKKIHDHTEKVGNDMGIQFVEVTCPKVKVYY